MIILNKQIMSKCTIKGNGINLRQVQTFKHLGIWIISDGRCFTKVTEIRNRMRKAKTAFHKIKNILCNIFLSLEIRKTAPACYIEAVITICSESLKDGK